MLLAINCGKRRKLQRISSLMFPSRSDHALDLLGPEKARLVPSSEKAPTVLQAAPSLMMEEETIVETLHVETHRTRPAATAEDRLTTGTTVDQAQVFARPMIGMAIVGGGT